MMIRYTKDGKLEPGIYSMTANDFLTTYCDNGNRSVYKRAVINIFDFAKANGATRIIIGGSFITKIEKPHDLDCMIVFVDERHIPTFLDCAQMDNLGYDLLYSSEKMPKSVDTFIKMMSTDEFGREDRGVVEVRLDDKSNPWKVVYEPNGDDMEIISRVYCERSIIERSKRRGILVVIHGLMTKAEWLSNLVPAANSQGWIVAPFIYDGPPTLLFYNEGREKVVERFREWIYALKQKYGASSLSVLCHSFGTYIITKYIEGFSSGNGFLPLQFDSIILTGSIIRPDYDWNAHVPRRIGRVLNIVAGGDDAVKFMPKTDWKNLVGMDPLFGQGAIKGVANESAAVENRRLQILTHTNIFKDDVIEQVFLPYLNANNGIANREGAQDVLSGIRNH